VRTHGAGNPDAAQVSGKARDRTDEFLQLLPPRVSFLLSVAGSCAPLRFRLLLLALYSALSPCCAAASPLENPAVDGLGAGSQDRTRRAMAAEASFSFASASSPPAATASTTQ
jgi:hypothetical protein